ncbi:FO synthase [Amycolatopsis mediterranei]|nr:FO synthase [Amycolatopsis mediterranei]
MEETISRMAVRTVAELERLADRLAWQRTTTYSPVR